MVGLAWISLASAAFFTANIVQAVVFSPQPAPAVLYTTTSNISPLPVFPGQIYPVIAGASPYQLLPTFSGLPQFALGTGPKFTAKSSKPQPDPEKAAEEGEEEPVEPVLYISRLGARNLDLCYFLGSDIFTSHVACNERWADGTLEGVKKYINELTFETNKLLGENNLKLSWKGPFARHDSDQRYPTNPSLDTVSVYNKNCDAVVFLVFNKFSSDCQTAVDGHQYAGQNKGGMCETQAGTGYTIVVDQGYLEDVWTGPQILAHHLLRMLIADLPDNKKTCPNKASLLHPQLYPGTQTVDQCTVDLLNQSNVSNRPCMQD